MVYVLTLVLTIVISLAIINGVVRVAVGFMNSWNLKAPSFLILYVATTFIISVALMTASWFTGTPFLGNLTFSAGLFLLGGTLLLSLLLFVGREGLRDHRPDECRPQTNT